MNRLPRFLIIIAIEIWWKTSFLITQPLIWQVLIYPLALFSFSRCVTLSHYIS